MSGTAYCTVRLDHPPFRADAIRDGLHAVGLRLVEQRPADIRRGDALVIWNRYGRDHQTAKAYEAAGGLVIVMENAFIEPPEARERMFSVAAWHHNGAGDWVVGDEDRWSALNIPLAPWRDGGEHILVLPQRGIGTAGVAMPLSWKRDILADLAQRTKREVRVRQHPGQARPPLNPDLENCWAAVTWGSGAAIKAIVAGVPVFHSLHNWIGAGAALPCGASLEKPFLGDRLPMLRRLAHHQWSLSEVAAGIPFRRLIKRYEFNKD